MKLPHDHEGIPMVAGDCYRGETRVAEIQTIGYDADYKTYIVSYGIIGTMAGRLCSLKSFLERFPYRVEPRSAVHSTEEEVT